MRKNDRLQRDRRPEAIRLGNLDRDFIITSCAHKRLEENNNYNNENTRRIFFPRYVSLPKIPHRILQ